MQFMTVREKEILANVIEIKSGWKGNHEFFRDD